MKKHVVYWIHLPNQSLETQGYVGVTNNFNIRMNAHRRDAKKKQHRNNYLQNVINKYQDELIYEVILEDTEENCYAYEKLLRPTIKVGWNISIGGEIPNTGREISDETRALWSKLAKERGCAHMHTPEVAAKISAAMQGAKNHQAKEIICIDTGEIFPTAVAAGKHFGITSQMISRVARGLNPTAKGKTFKFTKDIND